MKKILIISPQVVLPANDGGKKCIYYQVKNLLKYKVDITLVMGNNMDDNIRQLVDEKLGNLKKVFIFNRVNREIKKQNLFFKFYEILKWLISLKPRQAQTIYSKENREIVTKYIIDNKIDYVILETPFAFEYLDIKKIKKYKVKIITREHNVEYLFRKDCLENFGEIAFWEIFLTKRYEKKVLKISDKIITISPKDKEILRNNFKLNNIKYVPTFWEKSKIKWENTDSNYILFSGSLNFYPNYHGMKYFLKNIYFEFSNIHPNIKLKITGSIDEKIKEEFLKYKNVEFTGFLSDEEMKNMLKNCLCMIIPIIKGSGIKIKLLEALSMGIPVIATNHCFEGIPYEIGSNIPYLVAKDNKDFIDKLDLLIKDKDFRTKLNIESQKFFYNNYTQFKITDIF